MWFKNLRAYRLTQPFDLSAEQLAGSLGRCSFTPCGKTQPLSQGWVPPLGEHGETLVHGAEGRLLLRLKREERILPPAVVREMLGEKIAAIEAEQGRKVYRRERLGLKDEIVQDCLPRAFTRSGAIQACIDSRAGWIFIDAASASRAEDLLNLLRECTGSFPVVLPQTQRSPAATMTGWLVHRGLPDDFALGGDCELREPGGEGGVVRCRGLDLLSEEVEAHLQAGREVARLALDWQGRVSFLLADDLCLRRLKFADELLKENEDIPESDPAARLDADFALLGATLSALQQRLMELFGGLAE